MGICPQYNLPLHEIRELYPGLPNAFLDNAASPLFPSTIAYKAAELLCSQPVVNPHSNGVLGDRVSKLVNDTRAEVLRLLKVDSSTHEVVFCANSTAAIKLVGECLGNYNFCHLVDSHTSIVGLRELAAHSRTFRSVKELSTTENTVVSWPLQSNFSGKRYPGKEWVEHVNSHGGGITLLDIASFCSTEMPNLGEIGCDLATLSFYKLFGFVDLGALVVRKSSKVMDLFTHKKYYGGGTVNAITPSVRYAERKTQNFAEMLEDGTLPVHSIISLNAAIGEHLRLFKSFDSISTYTKSIAEYCRQTLKQKFEGQVHLLESDAQGPIVTFIIPSIGHNEFIMAANAHDVHLRTGTMCNIGAFISQASITDWTDQTIIKNHQQLGKNCNDGISFINGKHTGAIRASFGPYSSVKDVDALNDVIKKVLENAVPNYVGILSNQDDCVTIEDLNVFPIKSCRRLSLKSSKLMMSGLQYDREFCIVDLVSKSVLSLKKCRSMIFIEPSISDDETVLHVAYNNPSENKYLTANILRDSSQWESNLVENSLILNLDPAVVNFFSFALNMTCTIAKSVRNAHPVNSKALETRTEASLANSSPLLIVNITSAEALGVNDINVFRPNIIVRSNVPWAEDSWEYLQHGETKIPMMGKCRRCNMVCVTSNGESDNTPYMQLCKLRKIDGRLYFGCHASMATESDKSPILRVGEELGIVKAKKY